MASPTHTHELTSQSQNNQSPDFNELVSNYRQEYSTNLPEAGTAKDIYDAFDQELTNIQRAKLETPTDVQDDREAFKRYNAKLVAFAQTNIDNIINEYAEYSDQKFEKQEVRDFIHQLVQDAMMSTYDPFDSLMHDPVHRKQFLFSIEARKRATAMHKNYVAHYGERVKKNSESITEGISEIDSMIDIEKDQNNKFRKVNLKELPILNANGQLTGIADEVIEFDEDGIPIISNIKAQELSNRQIAQNLAGLNAAKAVHTFATEILGLSAEEAYSTIESMNSEDVAAWLDKKVPANKTELLGWFSWMVANSTWQICQEPKALLTDSDEVVTENIGQGSSRLETIYSLMKDKGSDIVSQNLFQIQLGFSFIKQDIEISKNTELKDSAMAEKESDLTPLEKYLEEIAEQSKRSTSEYREKIEEDTTVLLQYALQGNTTALRAAIDSEFLFSNGVISRQSQQELLNDLNKFPNLSEEQKYVILQGLNSSVFDTMMRAEEVIISPKQAELYSQEEKKIALLVDANYRANVVSSIEEDFQDMRNQLSQLGVTSETIDEQKQYTVIYNGKECTISGEAVKELFQLETAFGTFQEGEETVIKNTKIDIWNPIFVSESGELSFSALGSWDKPYQTFYKINPETGKSEIYKTEVQDENGEWIEPNELDAKSTAKNFAGIETLKNLLQCDTIFGGKENIIRVIANTTEGDLEKVIALMNNSDSTMSEDDLIRIAYLRYSNASWQTFNYFEGIINAQKQFQKLGKSYENLTSEERDSLKGLFLKRVKHNSFIPYNDLLSKLDIPEIDKDIQQGVVAAQLINELGEHSEYFAREHRMDSIDSDSKKFLEEYRTSKQTTVDKFMSVLNNSENVEEITLSTSPRILGSLRFSIDSERLQTMPKTLIELFRAIQRGTISCTNGEKIQDLLDSWNKRDSYSNQEAQEALTNASPTKTDEGTFAIMPISSSPTDGRIQDIIFLDTNGTLSPTEPTSTRFFNNAILEGKLISQDDIVLDMCAGSGITAVVAGIMGCTDISAADISSSAIETVNNNSNLYGFQINDYLGSLFDGVPEGKKFTKIFMNPPFPDKIETENDNASKLFEAVEDEDYFVVQEFFKQAKSRLAPDGEIYILYEDVKDPQLTMESSQDAQYPNKKVFLNGVEYFALKNGFQINQKVINGLLFPMYLSRERTNPDGTKSYTDFVVYQITL